MPTVMVQAYSQTQVNDLINTVAPFLKPGDWLDLVSGNNKTQISTSGLKTWLGQLQAIFPTTGDPNNDYEYSIHTGDYSTPLDNVKIAVADKTLMSLIDDVLYDYQPSNANFTFDFPTTLTKMTNFANALVGAVGLQGFPVHPVAYPTGRPVLESDLQKYNWDYGKILTTLQAVGNAGEQIIQTQAYAGDISGSWTPAINKLLTQYSNSGLSARSLVVQVTVGTGGNAQSPAQCYAAFKQLLTLDPSTGLFYIWWSNPSDLTQLLQLMGR